MDILELAETAPIANPEDMDSTRPRHPNYEGPLFRMWVGERDATHVYVWAKSMDDALEVFAEWIDDNEPGHLTDVTVDDLKESAKELGLEWKSHWPDFEDRDFEKVAEHAETDLTNIGHTTLEHGQYLRSWEWGGEEVHAEKELEIVRERSEDEADDDEGEALESNPNPAYTHFVVTLVGDDDVMLIQSGWEYKEDAKDALADLRPLDRRQARIMTRRRLKSLGIDPDSDKNWLLAPEQFD